MMSEQTLYLSQCLSALRDSLALLQLIYRSYESSGSACPLAPYRLELRLLHLLIHHPHCNPSDRHQYLSRQHCVSQLLAPSPVRSQSHPP